MKPMCKVSAKSERITWGPLVELAWNAPRPTLKNVCFLSPASQRKEVTQAAGKTFFYLIQTKYYFLFQMLPSP